jgi:hypothetical protein
MISFVHKGMIYKGYGGRENNFSPQKRLKTGSKRDKTARKREKAPPWDITQNNSGDAMLKTTPRWIGCPIKKPVKRLKIKLFTGKEPSNMV